MKRVVAYFAAAAFAVLGAFAGLARAQSDAAPASKLPESFLSANGQEFKLVSSGVFMMGNGEPVAELIKKFPGGQQSSMETSVSRRVTLTQPFYLATRLTTVGDFRRFVEATGYKTTAEQKHAARALDPSGVWADMPGLNWQEPGFEQGSKSPVVCVSYYDALAYVNWLNATAPAEPTLGGKPRYVLPTEAQWEYAARAGATTEYFWGDDPAAGAQYLNAADAGGGPAGQKWTSAFPFSDGYGATSPVGSFEPNGWGFYDMLGNVWEWCEDRFETYGGQPVVDPRGALFGEYRVLRGGGWDAAPALARCAYRGANLPDACNTNYGFRVAIIPPTPAPAPAATQVEEPAATVAEEPGPQAPAAETPAQEPEETVADQVVSDSELAGGAPRSGAGIAEESPLKQKIAKLGLFALEGRKVIGDDVVTRAVESITVADYREASAALKAGKPLDETVRKKIKMAALLAELGQANVPESGLPNYDLLPAVAQDRAVLLGSLAFIGQELLDDKEDEGEEEPNETPK